MAITKELKIEIKLLNAEIIVFFTTNVNDAIAKYGIISCDYDEDYVGGLQFDSINKHEYIICYIMEDDELVLPHSTLVHEAKHVINRICYDRGIKLTQKNDEFECYFLGNLVNEIILGFQQFKSGEIEEDIIETYL